MPRTLHVNIPECMRKVASSSEQILQKTGWL
jgi:hypothetical protein